MHGDAAFDDEPVTGGDAAVVGVCWAAPPPAARVAGRALVRTVTTRSVDADADPAAAVASGLANAVSSEPFHPSAVSSEGHGTSGNSTPGGARSPVRSPAPARGAESSGDDQAVEPPGVRQVRAWRCRRNHKCHVCRPRWSSGSIDCIVPHAGNAGIMQLGSPASRGQRVSPASTRPPATSAR